MTKTERKGTTICVYFGAKHTDTLERLDGLADEQRLSRTQTIEFLLRKYEELQRWQTETKQLNNFT